MICMSSALNYTDGHQFDFNSNHTASTQYNAIGVKAQRIVKVLIFMIMDDCAIVQSDDDMELWRYVEQFRCLTPAGG